MNSINDIPAEILISKIVAANNDFITRQNDRQEKMEQRYIAEKKEIISEIKKVSHELTGFKENFIMLSGEVSQIKKSILSENDLKKLTFECIEVFENKKIAGSVKRKDDITQTIELSKQVNYPSEPKMAFYKKPMVILPAGAAGISALVVWIIEIVRQYFTSTGKS